jgi:hypothetical protein
MLLSTPSLRRFPLPNDSIVHENQICMKLLGQGDCCQFSYAQWGSCRIDIGLPNIQPSWWRSDPSSYCDWGVEIDLR